ncbi:MAG TPA: hypothetical protein PLB91_06890 [Spirochaetales bacterium]|nr:hypothetical protein [Spirochaetales bacterium]HRY52988.1 hypothetical protein [Spirochaetia bacterium]
MKFRSWLLLALLAALAVYSLASPSSLAGIALRRAWQGLDALLEPSDDPEPVEVVPGAEVPMEVIPW